MKNRLRRVVLALPFLLLLCLTASAQVGTWRNYLAYHDVQNICEAGQYLFVLASNGLYTYNKNDQSITTYDRVNGLSDTHITHIAWSQQAQRLICVYQNSNIDLIDTKGNITNISALYTKTMTDDKTVNAVSIDGIYAWLECAFGIIKVNMQRAEITDTYTKNHPDYPASLPAYDEYQDLAGNLQTVSALNPGGPKYNHFGSLRYANGQLYTCGGGNNTIDIPGCLQILKDGEWTVCQDEGISEKTGVRFINTACLDIDPTDANRIATGSRTGLYIFQNGQLANFYNDANSPIEAFNGTSKDYELVYGVKYTSDGTLWMLNSQAPTQSLISLDKNGKFNSHSIPQLMRLNDGGYTGKSLGNLTGMTIDSKGLLWFVNNHWIYPSLYRYDTASDEIKTYANFVNQDGAAINGMYGVSCVTEDLEGNMWIGTDVGPFVLEKSQTDAESPVYTQVKVPRNDGTNYADYLLNMVSISCIAIDAANRKWIGTAGNGVYLISADNMTQLEHFTIENSKLLSNTINSIALNPQTGEVYMATEAGLCSYVSDAIAPQQQMTDDSVWAYPNPVTPEYSGLITIVGLTYDADVKITSANGSVIAEGRSNGGSFTWDGCDQKGRRVASGVYMVVTATSDGNKGTVCKIAVIN